MESTVVVEVQPVHQMPLLLVSGGPGDTEHRFLAAIILLVVCWHASMWHGSRFSHMIRWQ